MACDNVDLITFHLVGSRRSRRLAHYPLASLPGHLLHVVFMKIEFVGNLVVREVESHEIQAQYPHPQGLMMAGKDRVRQIIKASLAGLAQVALTLGLGVVTSLLGNVTTITLGTRDTLGPAEEADSLKTFGVVDERLYVYHDASIAH